MIYIRNLFTQDLREGKQIAFPTEPSNIFFKFNFSNKDPDRKISFKFKEKDYNSPFFTFDGQIINTRIFSAGSESRIDGELRHFLKVDLHAEINDIIVFRALSPVLYEFEFVPNGAVLFNGYKSLLNGKNHEVVIEQDNNEFNDSNSLEGLSGEPDNLKEVFANWFIKLDKVKHNYFTDAFGSNRDKFLDQLTKYDSIYIEQFGTSVFNLPQNELREFIDELERNLYSDNGEFFEFSLKTSTHMPRAILGKKNYLRFLKELLYESKTSSANSPKIDPVNRIYFGAPGTGKSYRIADDLKEVDTIFQKRVIFHPEYDNASFVGGYKPFSDTCGKIKYEFVPQIFTNIYVEACNDPNHQYYLIIEEINRGNCAEIFGELFQLLDRDDNYKITPSSELINYLDNNIQNSNFYLDGMMLLPDNLSIIATMNTSDQSLFPMDSAFKRRWEWEYIPICYDSIDEAGKENISTDYIIDIEDGLKYSWTNFIKKINVDHIKTNPSLGMDKCIGNYFIKPEDGKTISLKQFVNKVIFYLWNDVFKDEDTIVFTENISYEDFFPIEKNGKKRIKELFERIKFLHITEPYLMEQEPLLGAAAEGTESQIE